MTVKINVGSMLNTRGGGFHSRRSALKPNGVTMAVHKGQSKISKCLAFCIGVDLMRQQRWVLGDRVTVDIDCDVSEITLRRVSATDKSVRSWALTGKSGHGKNNHGDLVPSTLKINVPPHAVTAFGMDDADEPYVPSVVKSTEAGLTFPMRKKWTVNNNRM